MNLERNPGIRIQFLIKTMSTRGTGFKTSPQTFRTDRRYILFEACRRAETEIAIAAISHFSGCGLCTTYSFLNLSGFPSSSSLRLFEAYGNKNRRLVMRWKACRPCLTGAEQIDAGVMTIGSGIDGVLYRNTGVRVQSYSIGFKIR